MRWLFLGLAFFFCGCDCAGTPEPTPSADPVLEESGFEDDFERGELGESWHNTGGPYRIEDGWLQVQGAFNKPLWLRRRLPDDVRIEVDVRSETPDGDIKFEVFGDGTSFATTDSYTATSYVIIFGGWNNSTNLIARMDEHGSDRVVGAAQAVEVGRVYRVKIERRAGQVSFWVDDRRIAMMDDADPLSGPGHDHFAFNNWQSSLWFDNLKITGL